MADNCPRCGASHTTRVATFKGPRFTVCCNENCRLPVSLREEWTERDDALWQTREAAQRREKLKEVARKYPPPQSWYDEDEPNPFQAAADVEAETPITSPDVVETSTLELCELRTHVQSLLLASAAVIERLEQLDRRLTALETGEQLS